MTDTETLEIINRMLSDEKPVYNEKIVKRALEVLYTNIMESLPHFTPKSDVYYKSLLHERTVEGQYIFRVGPGYTATYVGTKDDYNAWKVANRSE